MRGAFSLGDDEAVAAATTYLATSGALEPGSAGGAIVVYGASLDALCAVQALLSLPLTIPLPLPLPVPVPVPVPLPLLSGGRVEPVS